MRTISELHDAHSKLRRTELSVATKCEATPQSNRAHEPSPGFAHDEWWVPSEVPTQQLIRGDGSKPTDLLRHRNSELGRCMHERFQAADCGSHRARAQTQRSKVA